MLKHRGSILEHQNNHSRSPSHFMVMAKNSSKLAHLYDRETTAILDGDGRSRVGAWKQAVLGSRSSLGRGDFFRKCYHLFSFIITGRVVVALPNEPDLAILAGGAKSRCVSMETAWDNTFEGPESVGWVQPTGGKAESDGGLHPPYHRGGHIRNDNPGVLPEFEPTPKNPPVGSYRNFENGRTNLAHIGGKKYVTSFSELKFGQKHKTKWHLTTWTDFAKQSELDRSSSPSWVSPNGELSRPPHHPDLTRNRPAGIVAVPTGRYILRVTGAEEAAWRTGCRTARKGSALAPLESRSNPRRLGAGGPSRRRLGHDSRRRGQGSGHQQGRAALPLRVQGRIDRGDARAPRGQDPEGRRGTDGSRPQPAWTVAPCPCPGDPRVPPEKTPCCRRCPVS